MKIKKFLSLLLCFAIALSLVVPGLTVRADEAGAGKGMHIDKKATDNGDGTYTIELEAYATGDKVISEEKTDVPTDIILVLDQSGSMAYTDMDADGQILSYAQDTKNSTYYSNSDNLYYKDGDVTRKVTVERSRIDVYKYTRVDTGYNNYNNGWNGTNLYNSRDYLYVLKDGEYLQVKVSREYVGSGYSGHYKYKYTLKDDDTVVLAESVQDWGQPSVTGTDDNKFYVRSVETDYRYTYSYVNDNGQKVTLETSEGQDNTLKRTTLYKVSTDGMARLDALKLALTGFANSVEQKATENNIDHRVAIVGFSSDTSTYHNTEILTGCTIGTGTKNYGTEPVNTYTSTYYFPTGYAKNGIEYGTNAYTTAARRNALVGAADPSVDDAIAALTAYGGTQTQDGMKMANDILDANPLQEGEKRNRVIVVFTDGLPGNDGYDPNVARSAFAEAKKAKDNGVTVYTVGIFDGANANSAGSTGYNSSNADKGNYFCQNLSSNEGKVQSPSYYLSADNTVALNNIFQQISDQIESGGSSTTLTAETVIKDIVAPQFDLPEGATITLEAHKCTGVDGTGKYTWERNDDALGEAHAVVNGDKVDVTGFDFAGNYVGTVTENGNKTYRGNKLVIKFNVNVKDGFLGGNGVYTNTEAGVYENASAEKPVLIFPQPDVDIAIKDVTVTAPDKNVYLLGVLTAEQIKSGVTAKCGNVTLDLTKADENYGLEAWQNEYVDINVTYKDKDGNEITDLNDLEEDKTYTATVTVSPKYEGEATQKSDSKIGKINVFKPTVTWQDSKIKPGDTPNYVQDNFVSVVWKHKDNTSEGGKETTSTDVTMTGTEPTLGYTYSPDAGTAFSEETHVNVTTNIDGTDVDSYVTYEHATCTLVDSCDFDSAKGKFLVHMSSFNLTIKKEFQNETWDPNQTFVFHVTNTDGFSQDVVIKGRDEVTLTNLPVGTYVIKEDTDWSWRYEPVGGAEKTITPDKVVNGKAEVIFVNNRDNDKWIDGSTSAKNVFDKLS